MMLSWLCHCTLHAALPCPVYQLVSTALLIKLADEMPLRPLLYRLRWLTKHPPACATAPCTLHCLAFSHPLVPPRLPTTLG